jgi:hypothetical protein
MNAIATTTLGLAAAALLAAPLGATAQTVHAKLDGYQETPSTISTTGSGDFRAKIRESEGMIEWELSYDGLQGNVLQAHIHFGAMHTSGGISAFLCTNLGNSAGTQACPQSGTISGVTAAANVIGPAGQQLAAGEIAELIAAIRAGAAYVNVHSSLVPSGEIRGQIR